MSERREVYHTSHIKPKGLAPIQQYKDIPRIKTLANEYVKIHPDERKIIDEYLSEGVTPDYYYGYYTACMHMHAIAAKNNNELATSIGQFVCAAASALSNNID